MIEIRIRKYKNKELKGAKQILAIHRLGTVCAVVLEFREVHFPKLIKTSPFGTTKWTKVKIVDLND